MFARIWSDCERADVGTEYGPEPDLSVVIPSYDSAPWLPSTLSACAEALTASGWRAQVIVVDDGSQDGTSALVRDLALDFPHDLEVVGQPNRGRFLARWAGLQAAVGARVLLLDSRVLLLPDSLAHVARSTASDPYKTVWNGHAITDPQAPLVGHFWEVPTFLFWGDYLRDPRPVAFGAEDFERHPKGTGVFLAPRDVLVNACLAVWPVGDASLSSDDTKLIRHIAEGTPIHLDPGFAAVYRPRATVHGFVRHSLDRGTFLVDSFAGTSRRWSAFLLALAVVPVGGLTLLAVMVSAGEWLGLSALAVVGLAALAAPAVVAARRGCPGRGVMAYLTYVPVFAVPYWFGLLRGLVVHRRNLAPGSAPAPHRSDVAHR